MKGGRRKKSNTPVESTKGKKREIEKRKGIQSVNKEQRFIYLRLSPVQDVCYYNDQTMYTNQKDIQLLTIKQEANDTLKSNEIYSGRSSLCLYVYSHVCRKPADRVDETLELGRMGRVIGLKSQVTLLSILSPHALVFTTAQVLY